MSLPPGYVALVERIMVLIPQWCEAHSSFPILEFYDHGKIIVGAALDASGRRTLAKSPDAFALLEWLEEMTDHKATVFQVAFALRQLGYLVGAEVLTMERIRELGFITAGPGAGGNA